MSRGSTPAPTRGGGAFIRTLRDRSPVLVASYQRRRILIAATAAFAQGYERTAVQDVVEPAGVSRRTVYDLFEGKDAIFRAAHARALAALRRRLRGARSAGDSELTRPDVALVALLAWATAEPTQALLIFAPTLVAGPHAGAAREPLFGARTLTRRGGARPWRTSVDSRGAPRRSRRDDRRPPARRRRIDPAFSRAVDRSFPQCLPSRSGGEPARRWAARLLQRPIAASV